MSHIFTQLDIAEFGNFLKDPASEKLIFFSLQDCAPCDALKAVFSKLMDRNFLEQMALYMLVFPSGKAFPEKVATELGIRHFPTVFYFVDNVCAGRIRGLVPKSHEEDAQSLANWFERARDRVRHRKTA